jgi:hypothetical protein
VPSWFTSALASLTRGERALYLASLAAVALSWAIASRVRAHRPVAALLSVGFGVDVARRALKFAVLAPAHARFDPAPLEGWSRAGGHVETALFLAWPAALVATARVIFDEDGGKRRRLSAVSVAMLWAFSVGALALAYPITRGAVLARCYLAVELASLLVVIVTIGAWVQERRSPEVHHVVVALVATAELCTLMGPWRINLFGSWPLAQSVYLALFVVLLMLQGGALWMSRRSSR